MPVMINRHSARMLNSAELQFRLDPMGWILNGAIPKSIKTIQRDGYPPVGEMVAWIDLEFRLTIGHLGEVEPNKAHPEFSHQFVYSKDPKDFEEDSYDHFAHKHMIKKADGDQFRFWINFENPEKLRYYRESKILTSEGIYNLRFRPVSSLPKTYGEWSYRFMSSADIVLTLITLDNKIVSAKVTKDGLFKVADFEAGTFSLLGVDDIKAWAMLGFPLNDFAENMDKSFQFIDRGRPDASL